MAPKSTNAFLTLTPDENADAITALASPVRIGILKLLRQTGPMNVNMISAALGEHMGAVLPITQPSPGKPAAARRQVAVRKRRKRMDRG